jgi:hypothetical protein
MEFMSSQVPRQGIANVTADTSVSQRVRWDDLRTRTRRERRPPGFPVSHRSK